MIEAWAVATVSFGVLGTILTILYRRTVSNSRRIGTLEVSLGELKSIPSVIEKHEQREDKHFEKIDKGLKELDDKLDQIAIDVAVIKRNGSTSKA